MPGPEAFSNPFEGGQINGSGLSRNPSAIGSGRGRVNSTAKGMDGNSPTSQQNGTSTWNGNHAIHMRKLPASSTKTSVRNMLLFSQDCLSVEMIPSSPEDRPCQTAIARFESNEGALRAAQALNGKQAGDEGPQMVVEVITVSPGGSIGTRPFHEASSSEGFLQKPNSRFSETFRSMDRTSPPHGPRNNMDPGLPDGVSPTFRSAHPANGASFGGQSPIGQPLERQHVSGRSMIQEDGADDETNQIMQDPGSFMSAERQMQFNQQGRRATAPHIALTGRMAGLSINSNVGPPMPQQNSGRVTSPRNMYNGQYSSGSSFSHGGLPGAMNGGNAFSNASSPTNSQYQPYGGRYGNMLPPINPADQNPPCNTLYVGNLPGDTSEDELKQLFSKARGYRRLCYRMKNQGPMCFVEFEDVGHATRALKDLYGTPLSNSQRGGIRLSFSKNPLGVRGSNHQSPVSPNNSQHAASSSMGFGGPIASYGSINGQSFSTAAGPPPGLPPPQGFGHSSQRSGSITSPVNTGNVYGNGFPDPGSRFGFNPRAMSGRDYPGPS